MNRTLRNDDYFNCPHCGAKVAVGASFCRECGASDECGWQDEDDAPYEDDPADYSEAEDFNYDEFIRREFPEHARETVRLGGRRLVAGFLVALMILGLVVLIMSGIRP